MGGLKEKFARVGSAALAVGTLGLGAVAPVQGGQESGAQTLPSSVDCDRLGDYRYVITPPPRGIGPGRTVFCPANSTVDVTTGAVQPKPPLSTRKVRSR